MQGLFFPLRRCINRSTTAPEAPCLAPKFSRPNPMKITEEEVQRVARLARLDLSSGEVSRMTGQLDAILSYVAKLDELDTTGVPATTHTQDVVNAFRDDIVQPSLNRERALANGPEQNGESFVVPRVIS